MSWNTLTQAHVNAIGSLVVAVSRLEGAVTDLIAHFMGTDIISCVIVTYHQQLSSKFENLHALLHWNLHDTPAFDHISQMLGKAKNVAEFRNAIVHALWFVDDDGAAYAVRFTSRGQFKRSRNPYTAEQIQQRADEALEHVAKLHELRDFLRRQKESRPDQSESEQDSPDD